MHTVKTNGLASLPTPTVPPETCWNALDGAISSALPSAIVIDRTIAAHHEYGLETFTEQDWKILQEVCCLLSLLFFLFAQFFTS
jgi:hypothetical protein